jgi:hypothetical protein
LVLLGLLLLLLIVFRLDPCRHRRLDGSVCNPDASQMWWCGGVLAVVAWPWPCRCSSMSWPSGQWRWCRHNLGYADDAAAQVSSSSSYCELTLWVPPSPLPLCQSCWWPGQWARHAWLLQLCLCLSLWWNSRISMLAIACCCC